MQFTTEEIQKWLAENDRANKICNGCGPKVKCVLGKIIYFLIPNWCFEKACNTHDARYYIGGCKAVSNSTRYEADLEFFKSMEDSIRSKSLWLRPLLYLMSWLYFRAVRSTGDAYFNWYRSPWRWGVHLSHIGIIDQNPFGD